MKKINLDFEMIFATIFSICVIVAIGIVIYKIFTQPEPKSTCHQRKLKQIGLSKEFNTSGLFIFLIGGFSGKDQPVYYFYYQTSSGGFQLTSKDINQVTIFEDTNDPYIEFCLLSDYGSDLTSWNDINIHVPPNSILNTVDLDINDIK